MTNCNYSEHTKIQRKENQKSPVEEAWKKYWGEYPNNPNEKLWQVFQAGYNAAYEEKVEEQGTWNYDPDAKFGKQEEVKKLQEDYKNYKITDEQGETNPYEQDLNSKKPKTLYDVIADWWDEIFVNGNPSGQNIGSLVEQIVKLVPNRLNDRDALDDRDVAWHSGYNNCRKDLLEKFKGR